MANAASQASKPAGLSGLQKAVLGLTSGLLVLSAGARLALARGWIGSGAAEPGSSGARSLGGASLTSGGSAPAAAPAPGSFEALLPVFTEASFFGLIGFALGYLSRMVFKVALIFIALFFLGLQGLVHFGVVEQVDWPAAIDKLNALILNLKQDQTLSQWLTAKLPTGGGLLAGYLLGLKRG
jgi:uncharacterized membrane protein (Fun14 family)